MNPSAHIDIAKVDIAIIGGGMVGASLASMLAAALPSLRLALIDSQPLATSGEPYQPSFDARSTALAQGSADILRELGLWDELARHVTAIEKVHVSDRGHLLGGEISAAQHQLDAVGYVVENAWLGRVLLDRVLQSPSINCLAPARVVHLQPQADGALLSLQPLTGAQPLQHLHCTLAVIADGGDSPLRESLGVHTQVRAYGQTAIITNVEFTQPHNGIAYERFTDQGPIALLPLGENPDACRAALVWTLPSDLADEVMALDDTHFLAQLQQRFGFRAGRFTRCAQRHAYPLQLQLAEEQVRSHLVLLGNAAHFLHPVAGQGFNLALRDCAALVETLRLAQRGAQSLGDLAVLQSYMRQQALDQQLTLEFSDKLVRLFSSQRLPLIALRHLGLLSLELLPPVKWQLGLQTMGRAGRQYRWCDESTPAVLAPAQPSATAQSDLHSNAQTRPQIPEKPDLVIIGAGLVGAALACRLAQNIPDWQIALVEAGEHVDAYSGETFDPRVVALTHASQQLLDELGCWNSILAERACAYQAMQVWDGEGTASIAFDAADVRQPQLGHIVENSVALRALRQRLKDFANIHLIQPATLDTLSVDNQGGSKLLLSNGQSLLTPLLIAADGARSRVRELAGFHTREWDYGQEAIVTSVRCEKPHDFTAWQRFTHTGPLAFLPLQTQAQRQGDSHYCSIVWSAETALAQQLMSLNDADFCAALGRAFEYRLGNILGCEARYAIPLRQRHASQYIRPGIALVGDAAHNIHPLAGQGVNLGLLDVRALADELARAHNRGLGSGDYSLLRRYQRQRLGSNLGMMSAMEGFKRLFGARHLGANWLRNTGLRWCDQQPAVKKWFINTALGASH